MQTALAYARGVVAKRIPACHYVKQACQRQLSDLKRFKGKQSPYYFDLLAAEKVCRFIELLPHVKGPLARDKQLIKLEPAQCFALTTIFGWKRTSDNMRRFRRVYIEEPRGNAKSTLSSGVSLYMLCADDEQGAEVYSAATTADQARIVFGDARQMVRLTPGLRRVYGVDVFAHAIVQPRTGSIFKALAAKDSTLDGLNTHFGCIDELHAHKTRKVYDVIETSTGKRDQSLLWIITTAGADQSGVCYEQRSYIVDLLKGKYKDESQFGVIYTIDKDVDWRSLDALVMANPNWGVSVRPEVVCALQTKALQLASAVSNFKTKHLCVWTNADVELIDMQAWSECADPTLSEADYEDMDCVEGLDLASKIDIASRIKIFEDREGDGWVIFGTHYLPSRTIEASNNASYKGWADSGHLKVTEGEVTDFDVIEDDIRADMTRFSLTEVAFDPWQATQLASHLLEEGVPMVEVRQTVQNLSEPLKEVQAAVLRRKLRHDGNPVMSWMMSNVVGHLDAKDNIYPRKARPENKIDGVVALTMALARAIKAKEERGSVYNDMAQRAGSEENGNTESATET